MRSHTALYRGVRSGRVSTVAPCGEHAYEDQDNAGSGQARSALAGRAATYTETKLRGFMLLAGATSKRWYAQTLVNGRQVRVKVGDQPTLNAKEAREAAAGKHEWRHRSERREAQGKGQGLTLRQALEMHIDAKERSANTVESYRY